jgi:glutathione peroxidase
MTSIYDISVKNIKGENTSLDVFKDKVLLVVNVASKCGFTKQYASLQQIYQDLKDRGLVVMGFPCNQFGAQEPGSEQEIEQFCQLNYGVSFPMFAKIDVNGDNTHPLYKMLKSEVKGILGTEAIKWNFTKFLVDRRGTIVGRYSPQTTPEDLKKDIENLL